MKLADLQARFADALFSGNDDAIVWLLDDSRMPRAPLLDIYRSSIFASLTATLARTFPQVRRALGETAFRQAAETFIRAHPPTTPCLRDYGDRFPTFMTAQSVGADWARLSDLARQDWDHQVNGAMSV